MKTIYALLALSLILVISGCGTTAKFVYPASMKNLVRLDSIPIYNKDIAILPFNDFRDDDNTTGTINLYAVPLFPFGWVDYDRPEAARKFITIYEYDCDVSEDLPKALATSLRHSNLFNNAFFTFGGEKSKADYYITGDVQRFRYKGRLFSYCLSVFGQIFCLFGAPIGTSLNDIELKLQLRKTGTRKVLWEYTINDNDYYIQGLYYNFGRDTKLFSKVLEDGYNKAIKNLQKQMRNNPKKFGLETTSA